MGSSSRPLVNVAARLPVGRRWSVGDVAAGGDHHASESGVVPVLAEVHGEVERTVGHHQRG